MEQENNIWIEDEDEDQKVTRSSPSLGEVVTHLLERFPKKRKHRKTKRRRVSNETDDTCLHCSTNHASTSPVKMYGKKATIYEEKEDDNISSDDNSAEENTAPTISVPVDALPDEEVRLSNSLKLATRTITPCHLKNVFSGAYFEAMSRPRRFAVDISQRLDNMTGGKVYVLFEVMDDNNRNNYDWNQVEDEWETLDVEEYTNVR